ncbi:MAG: hypothetical protein KGL53_07375, partial [Elusimicrobia bacterium]|nr:hypothetical protein [Elusimicrobiota bacterium]
AAAPRSGDRRRFRNPQTGQTFELPSEPHGGRDGIVAVRSDGTDFTSLDGTYAEQTRHVTVPAGHGTAGVYVDSKGRRVVRAAPGADDRALESVTVFRRAPSGRMQLSSSYSYYTAERGDVILNDQASGVGEVAPPTRTARGGERVLTDYTAFKDGRSDRYTRMDFAAHSQTVRDGTHAVEYLLRGDSRALADDRARTVLQADDKGVLHAQYAEVLQPESGEKGAPLALTRTYLNGRDKDGRALNTAHASLTAVYQVKYDGRASWTRGDVGRLDAALASGAKADLGARPATVQVRLTGGAGKLSDGEARVLASRLEGSLGNLGVDGASISGRFAQLATFWDGAASRGDVTLSVQAGQRFGNGHQMGAAVFVQVAGRDRATGRPTLERHTMLFESLPGDTRAEPIGDESQPAFRRYLENVRRSNVLAMIGKTSRLSSAFVEVDGSDEPTGYLGADGLHRVRMGGITQDGSGGLIFSAKKERTFYVDGRPAGSFEVGRTTTALNAVGQYADYKNNQIRFSAWGVEHPMQAALAGGFVAGLIRIAEPQNIGLVLLTGGAGALGEAMAASGSAIVSGVGTALSTATDIVNIYYQVQMGVGAVQAGGGLVVGLIAHDPEKVNQSMESATTMVGTLGLFHYGPKLVKGAVRGFIGGEAPVEAGPKTESRPVTDKVMRTESEARTPPPETRTPPPETRTPPPDTRTPPPETRAPPPDTRTPPPETRTPPPETRTPPEGRTPP